jgi:hypothetical protein
MPRVSAVVTGVTSVTSIYGNFGDIHGAQICRGNYQETSGYTGDSGDTSRFFRLSERRAEAAVAPAAHLVHLGRGKRRQAPPQSPQLRVYRRSLASCEESPKLAAASAKWAAG